MQGIATLLQHRPAIHRIVFQLHDLTKDYTNASLAEKRAAPTDRDFSSVFEGGWTSNAFYLRSLNQQHEIANPDYDAPGDADRIFVGSEEGLFWQITHSNDVITSRLPTNTDPSSNSLAAHVLNQKLLLDRVLNLGILTMKNESAVWRDDKFVASYEDGILKINGVIYKNHAGVSVMVTNPLLYGALVRSGADVAGMRITQGFEAGPQYLLEFSFDAKKPLPFSFPNRICRSVMAGRKVIPLEQITILHLQGEIRSRTAPAFRLQLLGRAKVALVYSNAQLYAMGSNGQLKEIPRRTEAGTMAEATSGKALGRIFTVISIFGISVTFAIILTKIAKSSRR